MTQICQSMFLLGTKDLVCVYEIAVIGRESSSRSLALALS